MSETADALPLLTEPAGGVPAIIDTPEALREATERLLAGTGPVAVDAERAAGIRYGNRAFLIQLKRSQTGTVLIDPEALPVLTSVNAALHGVEWILHAATQDLGCLAERGMRPDALFDTEVAARLLNFDRFGLASLTEELLGVRLAKEHSAADWSTRPLPRDWLAYAALDVELLGELRDELTARLRAANKLEFARQEFAHLLSFEPATHAEPWRRVHGLGTVKTARGLGRVRAMWAVREDLAEERDVAPSRILPDRTMVSIATSRVTDTKDLLRFRQSPTAADAREFLHAIKAADRLPDSLMPRKRPPSPSTRIDRTVAKARLDAMKPVVYELARTWDLPHDLVISPRYVKQLANTQQVGNEAEVADHLTQFGARAWQVQLVAAPLAQAIQSVSNAR